MASSGPEPLAPPQRRRLLWGAIIGGLFLGIPCATYSIQDYLVGAPFGEVVAMSLGGAGIGAVVGTLTVAFGKEAWTPRQCALILWYAAMFSAVAEVGRWLGGLVGVFLLVLGVGVPGALFINRLFPDKDPRDPTLTPE